MLGPSCGGHASLVNPLASLVDLVELALNLVATRLPAPNR